MRREPTEMNAGSMADIAFLLLIFFLISTTIESEEGIFVKLPRKNLTITPTPFHDKNILDVIINADNELLVENERIVIEELTKITMNFIDNGSGTDLTGKSCSWCQGLKDPNLSDHPTKALIAIDAHHVSDYGTYIQVLNNIHKAYGKLRDRYALSTYQISYNDLLTQRKSKSNNSELLETKIRDIRSKYPLLVSDAEVESN